MRNSSLGWKILILFTVLFWLMIAGDIIYWVFIG